MIIKNIRKLICKRKKTKLDFFQSYTTYWRYNTILMQEKKFSKIISWSDGGDKFVIIDKSQFSSDVIPHYFKHKLYSSFLR